jgi:UDP-glucose 4-epimerase
VLPPWGTGIATSLLRRVGLRVPAEMQNQLRFGRGVDNRRFKAAGFRYGYTSHETVTALGEHMRLHPLMRGAGEPYRYEREVEEFLRWSPHVRTARSPDGTGLSRDQLAELRRALVELGDGTPQPTPAAAPPEPPKPEAAPKPAPKPKRAPRAHPRPGAPVDHYDDLESEEVISLLGSLEPGDLRVLRRYERDHAGRESVLGAIDSVLARSDDASGVAPGGGS